MSRAFRDDDIYDRPEFFDGEMADKEHYAEENIERLDTEANIKHDIAELF